ncbi:MAG: haloacid dehalogenase type II [Pseudomonadota bacterium]|nr:haloacid dehalogenase type II [Pseudomonadota bacterium]
MVSNSVKALFFDVFGTLVDWRSGVARETALVLEARGLSLDWLSFADAWRAQYQPAMEEVRSGRLPYTKLDVLHRQTLQRILPRFGIDRLADADLERLTLAWHRLDAWPDVRPGLARLRQRFLIAPVSNGNTAIMCDLARRNDFHWDAILGADHARDFKPKAAVYAAAADAFGLTPAECMMCAAHGSDLEAAAAAGLRTAFIARPEERPGLSDSGPKMTVDISCCTALDLATQLGT